MTISTHQHKKERYNIPVESVNPHDPSLVPVDLDTAKNQARFALPERLLLTGARRDPGNESNKVQAERSHDLEDLVFDVLLLGKRAGACEHLLLADEDRGRDGREDERVKETEGKGLVLLRDDGGQDGSDGC